MGITNSYMRAYDLLKLSIYLMGIFLIIFIYLFVLPYVINVDKLILFLVFLLGAFEGLIVVIYSQKEKETDKAKLSNVLTYTILTGVPFIILLNLTYIFDKIEIMMAAAISAFFPLLCYQIVRLCKNVDTNV